MSKKVSIIMPTYNYEKFIESALTGILKQTYTNFELIIVDDGSTDNTIEILKTIKDERVKILTKEHSGIGKSLNLGFENATGEYETWTAADDLLYSTAIEEMVNVLETNPKIDFVYTRCELGIMDETGLEERYRIPYDQKISMEWNPKTFYDEFNIGIIWLWRKNLRIKAGSDYIPTPCEDYEMTTRMIEAGGKFYHLPKILGWRRIHNLASVKSLSEEYTKDLIQRMQKKRNFLQNKGERI